MGRRNLLAAIVLLLCVSCSTPKSNPTAAQEVKQSSIPAAAPTLPPSQTATLTPTVTPTIPLTPTSTPLPTAAEPTLIPLSTEPMAPETMEGVREVGVLGKGIIVSIDAARSSGQVAFATHLGVTVYDGRDLSELSFIRTDALSRGLAISADGSLLAGSMLPKYGEEATSYFINVWDREKQAEVMRFQVEAPPMRQAFSADRRLLAVTIGEGPAAIKLFDLVEGKLTCTLDGHSGMITGLFFSADGARLYSAGFDQTIRAWNTADCAQAWEIETGQNVRSMALSGDGRVLASINQPGDAADGQPDGRASGGKVFLWNAQDGIPLAELDGPDTAVTAVTINQDGTRIYTGDQIGRTQVLDQKGAKLAEAQAHQSEVKWIHILDEQRLLTASDLDIRLSDPKNGEKLLSREGYGASIGQLEISRDGAYLAAKEQNVIKVWDTATGRLQTTIRSSQAQFALFSADGERLLVGTGQNQVLIYSAADGALIETIDRESPANVGAVSADGKLLVVGSSTGSIDLYQTNPAALLFTLKNSENSYSISFSPDGKTLAAGLESGQIRIWSLPDGKLVTTLYKENTPVTQLTFSEDGVFLFSKSRRNVPRLWSTTSWQLLFTYNQGGGRIEFGSNLSPNHRLMAVSTLDFITYIKDAKDGRILKSFTLGNDIANAVVFSPDGSRLFAAGGYGVIYVYAMPK